MGVRPAEEDGQEIAMTRLSPPAILLVALMVATACDKNSPTQPTQRTGSTTTTQPPPSLQSITIDGPTSVVPGTHAQFTATGHISDGSSQDLTTSATWRSSDDSVIAIAPNGDATGGKAGEIVLAAESGGKRASLQVLVLAPGTFKVSGVVSDGGVPLRGATVDLVDGSRALMSSTTDADGVYRLYGVSGDIELRVLAPGYPEQKRGFSVASNSTVDFALPPGGVLTGSYDLSIVTDAGSCSGRNTLPEDLRARTYAATIAQSGPQLSVKVNAPSLTFGSFSGTQQGTTVTFNIHGITSEFDYYYTYFDRTFDLVEQLSPTGFLVISGTATTSATPTGLSGTLSGVMGVVGSLSSPYPNFSSVCYGKKQFALTRR